MTANSLQAVSTEDLTAMRDRAYRQLKPACQVADANQLPRNLSASIASIESAFLRYDDELIAREADNNGPLS